MWLWLLAISIVCAAVGLAIGQEKGRGFEGFVLGLLLGFLGVFMIAVVRPTAESEAFWQLEVEEQRAEIRRDMSELP